LAAKGRDGQSVPITVEHKDATGAWQPLGGVVGKVESGKISAEFQMPRLPPPENTVKGAPPADHHELRFRAKADDGREVISASALLAVEASHGKGALSGAHWAHGEYRPGDEAVLSVHATDLEGKPVRFVIEEEKAGKWSALTELRGQVKAGLA